FLTHSTDTRRLHSFPTRRSSDLASRTRRTARTLARAFRDQDDDLDLGHEAGTAARAKSSLVVTRDQWRPCLQWHTGERRPPLREDRKSTRLNSSHLVISYAVFCL